MSHRLQRVSVALLVTLALTACGSATDSGLQAVRDSERQMFFEIPSDWAVYHSADMAGITETPFVAQGGDLDLPVLSRVVFQGTSPDAGLPPANTSNVEYPVGAAVVRTIPTAVRDQISRYWLAELVIPYHSQPVAQEEVKQDISLGEGFDGVQVLVVYSDAETETDAAAFLISVTDPEVELMYSFAIGCSLSCFNTHVESIVAAVDSWLVNTR
jgi:hypothetical protein